MKLELSRFLFFVTIIVSLAAIQDTMPDFGGVKAPLLLSATLWFSFTRARVGASVVLFALCAGIFCDALCGLPFTCNTTFFLLAALATYTLKDLIAEMSLPFAGSLVMLLAAPISELWLSIWHPESELAIRFFSAGVCSIVCGIFLMPLLESLANHSGVEKIESDNMGRNQ